MGEPYIYEEYTLSAMVETDGQTISSRTVDLCYNSTLPSLYEIRATSYSREWFTLWKDGQPETGFYYYLPDVPMRFSASFTDSNGNRITDANAMEEVYVHVPRTDGVVTLKAEYNSSLNAWVTEEYKCGNNPPQNTWVSYTPAPRAWRLRRRIWSGRMPRRRMWTLSQRAMWRTTKRISKIWACPLPGMRTERRSP